jgi:hypothetical protein
MENLDKKIKRWKDEAYQIQAELEKHRDKKLRRNKKKKEERFKVEKKKKSIKNRKYGGRNSSKIS